MSYKSEILDVGKKKLLSNMKAFSPVLSSASILIRIQEVTDTRKVHTFDSCR